MTSEEIKAVEDYVNEAIESQAKVTMLTMPKDEAQSSGVEGSFWEKYPDTVKVYVFEDGTQKLWSKELCGGPHVESTTDIQQYGRFKIKKEQSSSAGVRRVKAVLSA
jgi:alanyl-tRNA synthetase